MTGQNIIFKNFNRYLFNLSIVCKFDRKRMTFCISQDGYERLSLEISAYVNVILLLQIATIL